MGSSSKRLNIKACLIVSAVSLACLSGSSNAQSENQSVTEIEALNILDEPRIDNLRVEGNVSQVLSYGPRYFVGLKARF